MVIKEEQSHLLCYWVARERRLSLKIRQKEWPEMSKEIQKFVVLSDKGRDYKSTSPSFLKNWVPPDEYETLIIVLASCGRFNIVPSSLPLPVLTFVIISPCQWWNKLSALLILGKDILPWPVKDEWKKVVDNSEPQPRRHNIFVLTCLLHLPSPWKEYEFREPEYQLVLPNKRHMEQSWTK